MGKIKGEEGTYEILCRDEDTGRKYTQTVVGYIYKLTDDISLGVTNKAPDGTGLGGWGVTLLPEGVYFAGFNTKAGVDAWVSGAKKEIIEMVTKAREKMQQRTEELETEAHEVELE